MVGLNHLHSDEPQPNLRRRCSRQQLAKGAAGRRLAVDLGDEVAHAKPGRVASATLDHVGDLVVVGVDRDSKRPALAFERHRQGALLRARGAASLVVGGTPRPAARLRWGAESAAGVISLSASSNFQPAWAILLKSWPPRHNHAPDRAADPANWRTSCLSASLMRDASRSGR